MSAASGSASARQVLILSEIFSARLVSRRGIPTPNVAAWNRTLMLARLLDIGGCGVTILSTGLTWRARTGFAWDRGSSEDLGTATVRYMAAIGPMIMSRAIAVVLLILRAMIFVWRERPAAVVAYNYSFSSLAIGSWCRLLGVRYVIDIEDITELDRRQSSISAANLQRCLLIGAMKGNLRLATSVIVPASGFARTLRLALPFEVIDYSMSGVPDDVRFRDERVNVLFCGPYVEAHGFTLLLDCIGRLRERGTLRRFRFHFTGPMRDAAALEAGAGPDFRDSVVLHGFLPTGTYRELVQRMDVGLSLQLRGGQFGATNTPSKSFEFLSAGLLLVCTTVGDQAAWSDRALLLLPEEGAVLAGILETIAGDRPRYEAQRRASLLVARTAWDESVKAGQLERLLRTG